MPCGERVAIRLSLSFPQAVPRSGIQARLAILRPLEAQFYHSENTCGNPGMDYALVIVNETSLEWYGDVINLLLTIGAAA